MINSKLRGFTLVELLVVITIIGILTSIIVTGLTNAKKTGRDAKRVSDLKNIQVSLALYYNDNLHYPCTLGSGSSNQCVPDFLGTYMTAVPKDPSTGVVYYYNPLNTLSGASNCNSNAPVSYHLGAAMETTGNLLTQDSDWASAGQAAYNDPTSGTCNSSSNGPNNGVKFDGNAAACTGTSPAGTDNCYDVAPN